MGLFSSKKTYVSSTVYNMAGDIKDRPNFLKTLMVGHSLNDRGQSISEAIQRGYAAGPGTRLRSFGRWSRDHYDVVGVAVANLYTQIDVSSEAVTPHIPHDPAETVNVQRVDVRLADFSFWAEQWILEHYPEQINTSWVSDYDDISGEVRISLVNGVIASFVPTNFIKSAGYIYVLYTTVRGRETNPVIVGPSKTGFIPTTGYTSVSSSVVPTQVILNRTEKKTISYSDGRPDEVTTTPSTTTGTYNYYRGVFEKTEFKGEDPNGLDQLYSIKTTLRLYTDGVVTVENTDNTIKEELNDGTLIKRTRTEVSQEVLTPENSHRIDTQTISQETRSPAKLFIYRLGSGNPALDATVNQKNDGGYYFPFIPLRLDNKFLSDSYQPAAYDASVKAYKKATSGSYDSVIDSLAENKDLKDIDYAYIMFGVALNTREKYGRKYLYEFFDRLRLSQSGSNSSFLNWDQEQTIYGAAAEAWIQWREAQSDPTSPLFGSAAPNVPGSSALPVREIRIKGNGSINTNMDIQISWQTISQTTGTGLKKPDAKKDDYWVEFLRKSKYSAPTYSGGSGLQTDDINVDRLALHWQVDENNWKTISITGLVHKNFIYKGKFVETDAEEALKDPEESGFIIPLHYDVFRSLSTVEATQLSTACCYMVINSYLVKKTGFFGSSFFKILLVVAVVAITVATGGIGATSVGLLGTNVAVGMAIGLTGTLAIIAGAVANAIVAMIVSKIISAGAVAVFGDKLGAIIGAIASLVTIQVGVAINGSTSLASALSSLGRAENIIAMTSSVGSGISGYIQAGAIETMNKTQKLQENYSAETLRLSDQFEEEFGYDRGIIDPLSLTKGSGIALESPNTFLERTLMTGSDVADMSLSLLTNYCAITLSTELPL